MNKIFISAFSVCACVMANSVYADAPEGYYDSLEGKVRTDLKAEVKRLARDHKVISYGSGTWNAFKQTDVRFIGGKQAWFDMYSDEIVYTSEGHPGMNIEHSVPNSWWGGIKNDAYNDLFHLNPSEQNANQAKSNFPLGEVGRQTWTNGVSTVGTPSAGQGGGCSYVFEPADEYKGDFARAYLYIFTIYDDIPWESRYDYMYDKSSITFLRPWAAELLLKWSAEDPVSPREASRNNAVYKVQGNRNPFIDLPQLAEYIWGSKNREPFTLNEENGIEEINAVSSEIIGVYDLQGRAYDAVPKEKGIYVIVRADGSREKVLEF